VNKYFPETGSAMIAATGRGLRELMQSKGGLFTVGTGGVQRILATANGSTEFIMFDERTLVGIVSSLGPTTFYPLPDINYERPPAAVLMDLDGTTVQSEQFWIWIMQCTVGELIKRPHFEFEEADHAHVSGRSVSEILGYCIQKYGANEPVREARQLYDRIMERELSAVLDGRGRADALQPFPGLKDFLLELKARNVPVALVTSGVHRKAWPEIVSVFRTLELGDPLEYYGAIACAGVTMGRGRVGTLGEIVAKPHPWLFSEAARIGLGLSPSQDRHIMGIEDTSVGILSIRLAGFPAIATAGGDIAGSGMEPFAITEVGDLRDCVSVLFPHG
jgi:beta-phosphoglucomutase